MSAAQACRRCAAQAMRSAGNAMQATQACRAQPQRRACGEDWACRAQHAQLQRGMQRGACLRRGACAAHKGQWSQACEAEQVRSAAYRGRSSAVRLHGAGPPNPAHACRGKWVMMARPLHHGVAACHHPGQALAWRRARHGRLTLCKSAGCQSFNGLRSATDWGVRGK